MKMPKAKLTDAVKSGQAAAEPAAKTEAATTAVVPPAADKAESDKDADADDSDADADADKAEDKAEDKETEAAAKSVDVNSLENFRAVFGKENGSVFFADKVDFGTACISHIATLNATIASQATKIGELEATAKGLATLVLGEAEPVNVASADKTKSNSTGSPKAYAEVLQEKMTKLGV